MTGQLTAKLKEFKNEMDYQNIDLNKLLCTRIYESEWLNGFLTVLVVFNLIATN